MRSTAVCLTLLGLALPLLAAAAPLPPGEKPAPTPFTRLDDAGTAADHPGADHVVVFEHAVNKVKPSGVTYVDGYRLIKILTPEGCRDRSVLSWHYDPRSQFLEVREVAVLRGGERIPVDVTAIHDLPAPQAAIYWLDRVKTLQLPRLVPGDGVEVVTFSKGFTYALLADGAGGGGGSGVAAEVPGDERYIPPMPGQYFDIVLFQADAPVVEKRYDLVLPADKRLHAETYNGPLYSAVTYDAETTTYSWWCLGMPARAHEPSQPDASDIVPKAVMATVESWEAKSRWFFDVNRNQFEVTPAIQAKVDEILAEAGATNASQEKKAKALVHWVAQNIRYSGQTMGEGEGFTLHPADMIFEQRSGVCKDIAGMLIAMMRGAGLDSHAAMTMAGSRIDLVPADQFNHCVTALRLPDGSWQMYDPTWVPYNNDIWSKRETEQHYLIGSPEGETLDRIPYSPPDESPLVVRHTAELAADGTLTGTLRLGGGGASDSRLRRMVTGSRKKELDGALARMLAVVSPRIEGVKVTHRAADDFSGDMWISIGYRIPRFATAIAGQWRFTSPMLAVVLSDGNLFGAGNRTWPDERQTDLLLWNTQLVDAQETIRLPKGWTLQDAPEVEPVDETYASFTGAAAQDGRTFTVTGRAEVRRRQIPPDGYPGFKAAVDAAKAWSAQEFRFVKGGK
ncbi:MAG: DUF3857 domain-containing transglutaminase family protein [Krumholzibacteria bacterium]|nr:DUF3857 domain-containing transglutaminase family protein [Candidatus Krumholzibacteria bacterium]